MNLNKREKIKLRFIREEEELRVIFNEGKSIKLLYWRVL